MEKELEVIKNWIEQYENSRIALDVVDAMHRMQGEGKQNTPLYYALEADLKRLDASPPKTVKVGELYNALADLVLKLEK